MSTHKRLALAGICLGALSHASCGEEAVPASPDVVAENWQASQPSPQPTSPSELGVRVAVPSHCGVLSVTIGGELWLAKPPLGQHNPPTGWDENKTPGYFVRSGSGLGTFVGDQGQTATFVRAANGVIDPNAGCE